MEECSCLVFDIGGTNLRAAVYDPATDVIGRVRVRSTPSSQVLGVEMPANVETALYREMLDLAADALGGSVPRLVSVAFPGPIDREGNLLAAPTVWGRGACPKLPLGRKMNALWPSARLVVLNDVAAAGYCYVRDPQESFCIVTVSSGIGNKIFLGGHPVTGRFGRGGEIGHVRVDFSDDAPECDCGGRGHLGAIASGRGTLALARKRAARNPTEFSGSAAARSCRGDPESLTNEMIVDAFREGDRWCVDVLQVASRPLGRTLATIHHALGVERFVIVGGFALALGDNYRKQLARSASESGWDLGQEWESMIALGDLGHEAALRGAGRYATVHHGAEQ
jgi:C7-cyclitol 7-kinase